VERKWKNYHITTFPGQSLSKTGLSLEEAMDLSRDRQIEEEESHVNESEIIDHFSQNYRQELGITSVRLPIEALSWKNEYV
jgi:hypothetical protein